jgi:hypothetical protein
VVQRWCGPLGLFAPICGGNLLPRLSFHERFYRIYKISLVSLGGANLLISYCRADVGLFDECHDVLQSLSKITTTNIAKVENPDASDRPMEATRIAGGGDAPGASNDDGCILSGGGSEDSVHGGASDDENSRTYYFEASTITLSTINEMVEKG